MNDSPLPDRPAAICCAAGFLERGGMKVLDRGWVCPLGHGQLDVAALHKTVFIAAVVRTRRPGAGRVRSEHISRREVRRLRRLARQWLDAHGMRAEQIRIDLVTVLTKGAASYTVQHTPGVG